MSAPQVREMRGYRGAKGHVEQGGKAEMISVRLDAETMAQVRAQSAAQNIPAARVLRALIKKGLGA